VKRIAQVYQGMCHTLCDSCGEVDHAHTNHGASLKSYTGSAVSGPVGTACNSARQIPASWEENVDISIHKRGGCVDVEANVDGLSLVVLPEPYRVRNPLFLPMFKHQRIL
jgi:hypothetical protein